MVLYGGNGRIGLILPHEDYTTEYEFNKLAPPDVAFYATRIKLKSVTREGLLKMSEEVEIAVERLPPKINLIVYHCTSGTFVMGPEWEESLLNEIKEKTGLLATSTMKSVVKALNGLKLNKISLVTPYTKDLNEKEIDYLAKFNVEVINDVALSITSTEDMCALEQKEIYKWVKAVDSPRAHGVFISCTGLKTMGLLDKLEEELHKPVVSSNSATLWRSLKLCGAQSANVSGYGRLFRL
jgi:maleate isomerase